MEETLSRRSFLRKMLAGLVVLLGGEVLHQGESLEAGALASPGEVKPKYALIIDTRRCVGCGACVEACNQKNHLPDGMSFIHILPKEAKGKEWFLTVQCQHCQNPPCASVCPTGATFTNDDGVVLINENTCVGCKYCAVACPYNARIFNEEKGVVDKCWLCLDWVMGGNDPACVQACLWGARIFGRQDDPDSEVAKLISSGEAEPLHPEFGTNPGVLHYIMR